MDTTFRKWIFASKIMSWPKLLVSYALGIGLGIHHLHTNNSNVDWVQIVLGFFFTLFLLLYIVFLNDYADREVDSIKRKMFPEESLKTIPDLILPEKSILRAGLAFGLLGLVVNGLIAYRIESLLNLVIGLGCFLFFYIYSFPPLKLNYRGGGEILEGSGVGVVLPFFIYYSLSPNLNIWNEFPIYLYYFLVSLASAIASGLSDEESDRIGGKTTFVTHFGNSFSRKTIFVLLGGGIIELLIFSPVNDIIGIQVLALVILYVMFEFNRMNRVSPLAKTNSFDSIRKFKKFLHNAIWGSILIISIDLMIG